MEVLHRLNGLKHTGYNILASESLETSLKNLSLNLAYQFQENFLCSEVSNEKEQGKKKKGIQSKRLQDLDDFRNCWPSAMKETTPVKFSLLPLNGNTNLCIFSISSCQFPLI